MSRLPLLALSAVLALGLTGPATASAAKKKSLCKTQIAKQPGRPKVDKRAGGITVYHSGKSYGVCSDKRKKIYLLTIADPGQRVTKLVVARGRCVAWLFAGGKSAPELLFHDMGAKARVSNGRVVGFGTSGASVGTLKMASNCSVAWSEIVGGAVTVYARGFKPFSKIPDNQSVEVGTAESANEARSVRIKSKGKSKSATVTWISGGVKQSKTLP